MRSMLLLVLAAFLLPVANVHAALRAKTVTYHAGDTTLKGYLVHDDRFKGRRPGILVVHEWWGLNDYARHRARMLAELGYTALAVDMYGNDKTAHDPKTAGAYSSAVKSDPAAEKARFLAAYRLLKRQRSVDPRRIGVVGYCFGGGVALDMARQGVPLDGVVSFHGSLGGLQPALKGKVKAKILVLTGAADPFNPPERVAGFEKDMKAAGADFRVISYPGAKHAFTNPEATALGEKFKIPIAYNAEADKKSWAEMKKFFSGLFGSSS
jgi:dienelactone hydrolase